MKRKLGIKDDDEDLINQKVRSRTRYLENRITDVQSPRRNPSTSQLYSVLYRNHSFAYRSALVPKLLKTCNCWRKCKPRRRTKSFATSNRTCKSI